MVDFYITLMLQGREDESAVTAWYASEQENPSLTRQDPQKAGCLVPVIPALQQDRGGDRGIPASGRPASPGS